ncbi:MAG: retroviral-like aspartic protease family protein, partial [Acidobacteria bacterium]|nr:retroviral-like aspartic protease family protein [Acidobacteriota bacterium]
MRFDWTGPSPGLRAGDFVDDLHELVCRAAGTLYADKNKGIMIGQVVHILEESGLRLDLMAPRADIAALRKEVVAMVDHYAVVGHPRETGVKRATAPVIAATEALDEEADTPAVEDELAALRVSRGGSRGGGRGRGGRGAGSASRAPSARQVQDSGKVCYNCGGKGHVRAQCPSPPMTSSQTRGGGSASSSRQASGAPNRVPNAHHFYTGFIVGGAAGANGATYVAASVAGQSVNALLDSGAAMSCVSLSFVHRRRLPLLSAKDRARAANGANMEVMGAVTAGLLIGPHDVGPVRFVVIRDLFCPVIIGSDVLRGSALVFDFGSNTASFARSSVAAVSTSRVLRLSDDAARAVSFRPGEKIVITPDNADLDGGTSDFDDDVHGSSDPVGLRATQEDVRSAVSGLRHRQVAELVVKNSDLFAKDPSRVSHVSARLHAHRIELIDRGRAPINMPARSLHKDKE